MIRKLYILLAVFAALASPALADTAPAGVRIVVPARDIARGEVLTGADLTYGNAAGNALMGGTITSLDAAAGMEARRVLRAGEVLSSSDLRRPVVVTKGQTVTMTFDAPGVLLTAMGRAMGEGGVGDTVTIQNPSSFRMITATVTGAGTVRAIGPASPQLTARK